MDFKDKIKQLGDRVIQLKDQVKTEEATKNADEGDIVANRTLQDYLGRNKKVFSPSNPFRVPYSENYEIHS